MKKQIILLAATALLAMGAESKSPKRGVGENIFQYKAQMEALEPGVSWYYTWGGTPGQNIADYDGFEFVPMTWNANFDAQGIREYVKAHPEVKYLLGFNEPNFTNQANLTPAEAAAKWPEVQALASELGLQLVAPALNYSPNPPYYNPTQWMDEFVAIVGNDAFDFLAIHNYGGLGVMQDLCNTFHDRYGKPVWVTEFCLWPEEGNPDLYVSPASQIASMVSTVEWLEKTDWIYRYAWFKPIGNSSSSKGPNYGLLLSGRGEEPRELSEQGKVYLNLPEFDSEEYHPIDTWIPAVKYITQSMAGVGSSADTEFGSVIEISQLTAGATVDYQFEVPESDSYNLELRVSGVGEPTRFDPTLSIVSVNADGSDGATLSPTSQFGLPGADDKYTTKVFTMDLATGRQTIRVKDMAPYSPSGIRISALRLTSAAGVESVATYEANTNVDVYSLQGLKLRGGVPAQVATAGLPAGIYIAGGKKIIVK